MRVSKVDDPRATDAGQQFYVMADGEHSDPVARHDFLQKAPDPCLREWIERRGYLIGDQEARPDRQRSQDRNALQLAA